MKKCILFFAAIWMTPVSYTHLSVETVVWSVGPDGEVIMDFRNLVAATSKPSGSTFFNTEDVYKRQR